MLLQQVLLPCQSPINWFPATKEEIVQRAQEVWPWAFSMHAEEMLSQLDRTDAFPGRVYTFVARRPLLEINPEERLQARIVALEARLHAREISTTNAIQLPASAPPIA